MNFLPECDEGTQNVPGTNAGYVYPVISSNKPGNIPIGLL